MAIGASQLGASTALGLQLPTPHLFPSITPQQQLHLHLQQALHQTAGNLLLGKTGGEQALHQTAGNLLLGKTGGEQATPPGPSLLQVTPGVSITGSQRSDSTFEEFFVQNPNVVPNVDNANANDPKITKTRGRPRKTSEAPSPTPPKKKTTCNFPPP